MGGIVKQAVIIIGGYNSLWPAYLKMGRDLEDTTGLRVTAVPLMPWHWWKASRTRDGSNILAKLRETVIWARRRFQADRFILVGHSAGGVIGRLYLCERPVWGQVYAGLEHVNAIVTLGSPHCADSGSEIGWFLTDEANRLAPGPSYSDTVTYHTVAGRYLRGCSSGDHRARRAFRSYQFFVGQGDVWGDGIVPISSAQLTGAPVQVLDGVAHSRKLGPNWYGGSKRTITCWWPPEFSDAG
jgi:pimeloyl-ACP methyl ester carboxylesterase